MSAVGFIHCFISYFPYRGPKGELALIVTGVVVLVATVLCLCVYCCYKLFADNPHAQAQTTGKVDKDVLNIYRSNYLNNKFDLHKLFYVYFLPPTQRICRGAYSYIAYSSVGSLSLLAKTQLLAMVCEEQGSTPAGLQRD